MYIYTYIRRSWECLRLFRCEALVMRQTNEAAQESNIPLETNQGADGTTGIGTRSMPKTLIGQRPSYPFRKEVFLSCKEFRLPLET